ncbi:MAG: hypothetical protein OXC07_02555, partial [Kistimonas sp.]|nr:hypothetical protein [Kistimonas sp.]
SVSLCRYSAVVPVLIAAPGCSVQDSGRLVSACVCPVRLCRHSAVVPVLIVAPEGIRSSN